MSDTVERDDDWKERHAAIRRWAADVDASEEPAEYGAAFEEAVVEPDGWDDTVPVKVDLTKLKPGDYVTVRTKVLASEAHWATVMPITIDPNPWANEIVAHEPVMSLETDPG